MTNKRLKEVLHYDWKTGILTWLIDRTGGTRKGDIAGYIRTDGYRYVTIDGFKYLAQRIIFLYMTGVLPTKHVDHISHNRDNNAFLNLRYATCSINSKNQSLYKNNTSGCLGVSFDKVNNKWRVKIEVDYKTINLGRHKNKATAITIRKAAECWYGFHKNHGVK